MVVVVVLVQHGKQKYQKRRYYCKECGGSSFCEYEKIKYRNARIVISIKKNSIWTTLI